MLPVLRSRFDELERQRRALLDDMLRHSPAQLAFRPRPGAWSLGDLIQHFVLVEVGALQFLRTKPPRPASTRTLKHRLQWTLFAMVAPRSIRVRAPFESIKPVTERPVDELVAHWDAAREQLAAHLEGITEPQLPLIVFKHPIGGPLPIAETLDFLRLHVVHHGHQIRRIRSAAGWPAGAPSADRAGAIA
jgi:hypothetical protein